ncbi:potassium channel family protein [Halieaceae bacterium]|nr:potassium channel family protein [Halieaceae bacterium]
MQDVEKTNGVSFLTDYFSDSDQFDYSQADSDFDAEIVGDMVKEHIYEFEVWLRGNCSDWVSISPDHSWVIAHSIGYKDPHFSPQGEILISNADLELLDRDVEELGFSHSTELHKIIQAAKSMDDKNIVAKASIKLAWLYDKSDQPFEIKARYWELAGKHSEDVGEFTSSEWYIKAAYIYSLHLVHEESARFYELALKQLAVEKQGLDKSLDISRKCRRQYDQAGDIRNASKIFVMEKELELSSLVGTEKAILWFHREVSCFGEKPSKIFWVAMLFIFIMACMFSLLGICEPGSCDPGNNDFLTNLYFSFVTFTTLGYGDFSPNEGWGRFLSAVVAGSGLFFSSLFLASIFRKYSKQ